MPRHPPPTTVALALLAAAAAVLGGCSPSAPVPTGATASPTPTPPAPVVVRAGEVTLEVTEPGSSGEPNVTVDGDDEAGTRVLTFDAATLDEATGGQAGPVEIALTSPGTFEDLPDGSVTVRDDDGAVGGLSAPRGARLTAVDDTHLEVRATGASAASPDEAEVTTTLGTRGVDSATWGDREGGRSLAVDPTAWARDAGQAGVALVWAELVATEPEVDSATMHDQLECHAIGAPDKATWNLEPWRPDVGLVATMAARCNPAT
ncbi:DUF2599 domain-containing protein [Isoptericola sp. NPDC055881]